MAIESSNQGYQDAQTYAGDPAGNTTPDQQHNDYERGLKSYSLEQLGAAAGLVSLITADTVNEYIGINIASPQAQLHVHNPASANSEVKVTNNTTGVTADDGLILRVNSSGQALLVQKEAQDLIVSTNDSEAMRILSNGDVVVGKTAEDTTVAGVALLASGAVTATRDSSVPLVVNRLTNDGELIQFRQDDVTEGNIGSTTGGIELEGNSALQFKTNNSEAARFDSSGNLLVSKTSADATSEGAELRETGQVISVVSNATCHVVNRLNSDGNLIEFQQDSTAEGNINVTGGTVALNGAHLVRWSQLTAPATILRGTVMSNLDEMCEWYVEEQPEVLWAAGDGLPEGVSVGDVRQEAVEAVYEDQVNEEGETVSVEVYPAREAVLWGETDGFPEGVSIGDVKIPFKAAHYEDNEQLNKTKISDVVGDANVAGVFQSWDDDDGYEDFYVAQTGDFVIRVAQGVTVARGDLLESAGDGTAKPQADDIVRSKTVAKVTSTHVVDTYDDGSYLVPCVLMVC